MKRYLFGELAEPEEFEAEFFADDELFDRLQALEDDLVELYAQNLLAPAEARRFEAGLEKFPALREKLANVVALRRYAESVKPEEKRSWFAAFFGLFNFTTFDFRLVAACLLVLLGAAGILFYLRNGDNQPQIARLENDQREIQPIDENPNQTTNEAPENIDGNRNNSQNSQSPGNNKTEDIERLKNESNDNRRDGGKNRNSQNKPTPALNAERQTSLAVTLAALIQVRGKNEEYINEEQIKLDGEIKTLNLTFELPLKAEGESFDVKLSETAILSNARPRAGKGGFKYLKVTVPIEKLRETNTFSITAANAAQIIGTYRLKIFR